MIRDPCLSALTSVYETQYCDCTMTVHSTILTVLNTHMVIATALCTHISVYCVPENDDSLYPSLEVHKWPMCSCRWSSVLRVRWSGPGSHHIPPSNTCPLDFANKLRWVYEIIIIWFSNAKKFPRKFSSWKLQDLVKVMITKSLSGSTHFFVSRVAKSGGHYHPRDYHIKQTRV